MNDRRDFLKKSVFLAAGMVAASSATAFALPGKFPPGIVYTKDNPGKWAKKVGSHAPKVKVEGKKVTLATRHPMSEKHYIVRHTLVSSNGKVLGSKTFHPSDKEAVSTYELPSNHGPRLYATSFCNLHDFWLTGIYSLKWMNMDRTDNSRLRPAGRSACVLQPRLSRWDRHP